LDVHKVIECEVAVLSLFHIKFCDRIILTKRDRATPILNKEQTMEIIIIIALFVILSCYKDYIKDTDSSHHDSQPYSYYQISQRALRDSRRF